eukprot:752989-Hanusia_phi.AAC.1
MLKVGDLWEIEGCAASCSALTWECSDETAKYDSIGKAGGGGGGGGFDEDFNFDDLGKGKDDGKWAENDDVPDDKDEPEDANEDAKNDGAEIMEDDAEGAKGDGGMPDA